jgi:hypothetical protein
MRRILTALAAASILVVTSACGDGDDGGTPGTAGELHQLLAETASTLQDASTFDIGISTDKVPEGIDALKSASGTANRQPAFKGTVHIGHSGSTFDSDVVAVDSKVWLRLFGSSYLQINPEQYGLPDPTKVVDGFTDAIAATRDLKEGHRIRDAGKVVRVITGTIAGSAIHAFIPSADADGTFKVAYHFTDDGILHSAVVTGPFYVGHTVTYTLRMTPVEKSVSISPPQ